MTDIFINVLEAKSSKIKVPTDYLESGKGPLSGVLMAALFLYPHMM